MSKTTLIARLRTRLTSWATRQPPQIPSPTHTSFSADVLNYQRWQRRFIRQRLGFGLQLAILAYLTFIALRIIRGVLNPADWDAEWLLMAVSAETGLLLCSIACRSRIGRDRPELILLAAPWTITLPEQIWATLNGTAFPGIYSWTLAFLTLATLVPVRWRLHLMSQLGILTYFYGVNTILGFVPLNIALWDARQLLYLFWFCCICDLSVLMYERLQRAEFLARHALEREQRRSERLLLNILPEPVAQQLKQDPHTIAESFAEVTVLFADIVGFTELSAGIPPVELVTLLNQIFSTFDHLAEKHDLEKIKTIGDSYMVVGGLPRERTDHAEAIATMALDMQQAVAQFSLDQAIPLSIRIGINTGPVVAGVIGTKKFIYDLWGDTVNVASRMESHGIAGKIQVTASAYDRLKTAFVLEERGMIDVKGKGTMQTYLLKARRS